jgi:hypothetical protein
LAGQGIGNTGKTGKILAAIGGRAAPRNLANFAVEAHLSWPIWRGFKLPKNEHLSGFEGGFLKKVGQTVARKLATGG